MFEVVVVTARGEQARPLTERWFRRYFGRVPDLRMRPSAEETSAQFKVRLIQELQPEAHFEDDPFTAGWVAEVLPRVFLVAWPRNRWLEGDNIVRARSVAAALPLLAGSFQGGRAES